MKKGFTLIELLVVVGVVLVLGATSANVIINLLRSYNKAVIMGEINENGSYVLTLMESQVRDAETISPASGQVLSLTVTPREGSPFVYSFGDDGTGSGMGAVKKDGTVLTNNHAVTGVRVLYDSGSPASASHFNVIDSQTVQIVLKLEQAVDAPERIDYEAETTLQTTVVVRGGYE